MKRVIIDEKKRFVKISFNHNFYKEDLINRAMHDFNEICNIKEEDGFIYLEPKKKEIELEKVGYEFYNYVLALIKNS